MWGLRMLEAACMLASVSMGGCLPACGCTGRGGLGLWDFSLWLIRKMRAGFQGSDQALCRGPNVQAA